MEIYEGSIRIDKKINEKVILVAGSRVELRGIVNGAIEVQAGAQLILYLSLIHI